MLGFVSHSLRMQPPFHLCFCPKTVPGTSPKCYRNASGVILGCIKNGSYHESSSCRHAQHCDPRESQPPQKERVAPAPPSLLESQVCGSFYQQHLPIVRDGYFPHRATDITAYLDYHH